MNFKQMRKDKKWTQVQAAKAVGVSIACWLKWENEVGNPNKENLERIKAAFGLKEGGQDETV